MEPIIYQIFDYAITSDPGEMDSHEPYAPEIQEQLLEAYYKLVNGEIRKPRYLEKLVEKYPHVPAFKNYLSVFYQQKGQMKKAFQVNRNIVEEHPDYLFGKTNLAAEFLEKGKPEEVPKILGQALDLKDLYPERKVFHISEFRALFKVAAEYLLQTGNIKALESRMEMAEEVLGADDEMLEDLSLRILGKQVEEAAKKVKQFGDIQEFREFGKGYDKTVQTDEPPTFRHEEIRQLYHHGLEIDHNILKSILELPREPLVKDLETVLLDSLRRYEHLINKWKEEGFWDEKKMSFPLHALFLLTELRATESLPAILEHLKQGEEFLNFWYEDHLFETLWHFLYHLGQHQLDLLKAFMLERNISYYGKAVVSQAMVQIALHNPEQKDEIIQWYEDILDHFLAHTDDEDLIDISTISHILSDIVCLSAENLLPKIKQFYQLNLVEAFYVGSYEDVEKDIVNG
ncbi:MAG TPA: DUF1186 domain-containing protein, partial [Bacteroidetes bacterium]|nr:DUF1186 domain-containing protein [Bacteroidota bacterium]